MAGKGEPVTIGQCIAMAGAKLVRVPGRWAFERVLKFYWKTGLSAIPPEALPYMTGEYRMNTERLQTFLGKEYEQVIRYSNAEAFRDSFTTESSGEHDSTATSVPGY